MNDSIAQPAADARPPRAARPGAALALLLAVALAACAGKQDTVDQTAMADQATTGAPTKGAPANEPVGWPLKRGAEGPREPADARTDPPADSGAGARALGAWPSPEVRSQPLPLYRDAEDADGAAGSRALNSRPEIAPLQRFTPDFKRRRIVYSGSDFSLTLGAAEMLDQLAMRLRETGEKIEILAFSSTAQLSTHEAVKLSFKRAMLVRLYLLDEGVSADQIELRALPDTADAAVTGTAGAADRVEIGLANADIRARIDPDEGTEASR